MLLIHLVDHFGAEFIHVLVCLLVNVLDEVVRLRADEVVLVAVVHTMVLRVEAFVSSFGISLALLR